MPVPKGILRIPPELWPWNKKELILEAPEQRWAVIGKHPPRTVFKLRYRKIRCDISPRGYNLLMNFHTDKLNVGDLWIDIIGNAQFKGKEHMRYIRIKPGCHFNAEKFLILDEDETRCYFPRYNPATDGITWKEVILPEDAMYKDPEDRGLLGCPGREKKEKMKVEKAPPITPEERERAKTIERAREGLKAVEKYKEAKKENIWQRILKAIADFFANLLSTRK